MFSKILEGIDGYLILGLASLHLPEGLTITVDTSG
jgi:hypothetical protein